MEIQRVKVKVMRDQLCVVSREVGAHEIPVLQAVFGDAAVEVVGDAPGTMTIDDVGAEYSRLATRHGFDKERKQSYAEIAYGRGNAQLAAALRSAEVKKKASAPRTQTGGAGASGTAANGGDGQKGSATEPT